MSQPGPPSSLASGPAWGLGQGGPRLKWAKARFWSKINEKVKVLKMDVSIMESLIGLEESIFNLFRSRQLHFGEKAKKMRKFIKFIDFPYFPRLGSLGLLSVWPAFAASILAPTALIVHAAQPEIQYPVWAHRISCV